jgi:Flp pilus assembly protein TadD
MALAEAKPDKAANWDAVRDWFLKANKLDTENAEPLELYYESYGAAHQPPTPNAVDALVYAMSLAPQDEQVRMNATMALLSEGKAADARRAFAMIDYQPHLAPQTREWADKVMQAIESGETKGALTLIRSFKPAPDPQKK